MVACWEIGRRREGQVCVVSWKFAATVPFYELHCHAMTLDSPQGSVGPSPHFDLSRMFPLLGSPH